MTGTTSPSDTSVLQKLTLRRLLLSMGLANFWKVFVAIVTATVAVIAFSGGVGYKIRDLIAVNEKTKHESQLSAKDQDIAAANSKFEIASEEREKLEREIRALETKEKFLALYLHYCLAEWSPKAGVDWDNPSRELRLLSGYIKELVRRGEGSDSIEARGGTIGKGGSTDDLTLRFNFDGSTWEIPKRLINIKEEMSTEQMPPFDPEIPNLPRIPEVGR